MDLDFIPKDPSKNRLSDFLIGNEDINKWFERKKSGIMAVPDYGDIKKKLGNMTVKDIASKY